MDIDELQNIAERAEDERKISQFPELVRGRILHADGDIFSYKACDLDYSYADNVQRFKDLLDTWRKLAGAEYVFVHLTLGTKGREHIATIKKYQGNRPTRETERAERVKDLRLWASEYSSDTVAPVNNHDQEADDSLCQAMYEALELGRDAVLFSTDKDLYMVPGKHLNPHTFELEEFPNGYGSCYLDENRKLKGKGRSWFWHQMLMGDQADNIPGLPYLTKRLWLKCAPPVAYLAVEKKLTTGRMPSGKPISADQQRKALEQKGALLKKYKARTVGNVMAYKYLEQCSTDSSAYLHVLEAYKDWYGTEHAMFTWDNKRVVVSYEDIFLEQARLLWMKRTPGEDVTTYLDSLQRT